MKKFSPMLVRSAVATGVALASFTLVASAVWVAAPGAPTYCPEDHEGCNPPLHEGYGAQIKHGGLTVVGQDVGTGNPPMSYSIIGELAPIWAKGGLVIQTCAAASCPDKVADATHPVKDGRIWLVQ